MNTITLTITPILLAGLISLSLCFYTLFTMNKSSILPTIFLGLAGLGLTLAGVGMAIAGWVQ